MLGLAHATSVVVTLQTACDLRETQWIVRQSPYCLLRYGSQEFRSRPSHRGGRHPVWNQTFRITLTAEDVLHVDIFDDSGCRGLTSLGHAAVSLAPLRTAASSGAGGGTSGTDEGQQQQQQQQLQQLQVQAPVLSGRRTVTAALQPPTTATSPQAAPARHKGPLLSVLLELAPPDPPPPVLRVAHAAAAPPLTTTTPAPQPALGIPAYPSQQPPPASPPPPLPPPLLHPSPYPPPPQDASAYPSSHPPPHAAVQHCLGARHQQHHNLHNGGGGAAGPAGWAQAMPYGGCGGGGVLGVPRWEYPVAPGAGPGKHYTHYMQALADAGLLAAAGSRAPVHMPGVEPGLQQ